AEAPRQGLRLERVRPLSAEPRRRQASREPRLDRWRPARLRRIPGAEPSLVRTSHAPAVLRALAPARRPTLKRWLGLPLAAMLLVAIDAFVIAIARALDPGPPVLYISNLAAVFIGAIQLLYGVPLVLWLRRKRPSVAAGIGAGMALVLALNIVALYR